MKKFEQKKDFLNELKKVPIKYFKIYDEQNMFDFSCPLIKSSIKEILEENELNNKFIEYNYDIDWFFENKVIYTIRVTNIIPKNYYIDNSYLIPSIFIPYKVKDLSIYENSLFYFGYCNIRRYDCALYLGIENALLFIKISRKLPKNKLEQYNSLNFETDLYDMQRFIKINQLKVKKYYLLFILLYSNNKEDENLKYIKNKGLSYILYDIKEKKFIGEIEKKDDLFEIKNTINSEKDIDIKTNNRI